MTFQTFCKQPLRLLQLPATKMAALKSSTALVAAAMVMVFAAGVAEAIAPAPAPTSPASTLTVPSYAGLAVVSLLSLLGSMVFARNA